MKWTHSYKDTNYQIISEEIKLVIKKLPPKNTQALMTLPLNSTEKLTVIIHKLFHKNIKGAILPTHFIEASKTQTTKQEKDITREKNANYRLLCFMSMGTKILTQILAK